MLITLIVSLTIFYSVYKYYNKDEDREEMEEDRRYSEL